MRKFQRSAPKNTQRISRQSSSNERILTNAALIRCARPDVHDLSASTNPTEVVAFVAPNWGRRDFNPCTLICKQNEQECPLSRMQFRQFLRWQADEAKAFGCPKNKGC